MSLSIKIYIYIGINARHNIYPTTIPLRASLKIRLLFQCPLPPHDAVHSHIFIIIMTFYAATRQQGQGQFFWYFSLSNASLREGRSEACPKGPKGRQLEVGAQRAPILLVLA